MPNTNQKPEKVLSFSKGSIFKKITYNCKKGTTLGVPALKYSLIRKEKNYDSKDYGAW